MSFGDSLLNPEQSPKSNSEKNNNKFYVLEDIQNNPIQVLPKLAKKEELQMFQTVAAGSFIGKYSLAIIAVNLKLSYLTVYVFS